jgi:hypothetical protein
MSKHSPSTTASVVAESDALPSYLRVLTDVISAEAIPTILYNSSSRPGPPECYLLRYLHVELQGRRPVSQVGKKVPRQIVAKLFLEEPSRDVLSVSLVSVPSPPGSGQDDFNCFGIKTRLSHPYVT